MSTPLFFPSICSTTFAKPVYHSGIFNTVSLLAYTPDILDAIVNETNVDIWQSSLCDSLRVDRFSFSTVLGQHARLGHRLVRLLRRRALLSGQDLLVRTRRQLVLPLLPPARPPPPQHLLLVALAHI